MTLKLGGTSDWRADMFETSFASKCAVVPDCGLKAENWVTRIVRLNKTKVRVIVAVCADHNPPLRS